MSDALVTPALITSAQNGDRDAIEAVLRDAEQTITRLAAQAASHYQRQGGADRDQLENDGRVAAWMAISRFDAERAGEDVVDSFRGYIYKTVARAMQDSVRGQRFDGCAGADDDSIKVFGQMYAKADGDSHLAEQMCRHVPPAGRRLDKDRARAARMAWQGRVSLDRAVDEDGATLAEMLADSLGVPEDMVTADDISREHSRVRVATVRAVLDSMGTRQADVLRHDYGIGVDQVDTTEELAAVLGTTTVVIRKARDNAKTTFEAKFITAYTNSPEEAQAWAGAAAMKRAEGRAPARK
ncbi:sigma factor [Streptomyces sp. Isolate_219]|uniref:sigma factor n=1 Tax=Streptomyces sp. Isolate_219 TaxID=2950110 RepID=UPI0021C943E1|nr:sigma factor [Streptomyces sp. Isolate_219]MCR8576435.1 hypothetical protein [Streptomyces sp. Isolate_219]